MRSFLGAKSNRYLALREKIDLLRLIKQMCTQLPKAFQSLLLIMFHWTITVTLLMDSINKLLNKSLNYTKFSCQSLNGKSIHQTNIGNYGSWWHQTNSSYHNEGAFDAYIHSLLKGKWYLKFIFLSVCFIWSSFWNLATILYALVNLSPGPGT